LLRAAHNLEQVLGFDATPPTARDI